MALKNRLGRIALNHFQEYLNTYRGHQKEIMANTWEYWNMMEMQ